MSPNIRGQRNKLHQRVMSQVGKAMRVKERKRKTRVVGEVCKGEVQRGCRGTSWCLCLYSPCFSIGRLGQCKRFRPEVIITFTWLQLILQGPLPCSFSYMFKLSRRHLWVHNQPGRFQRKHLEMKGNLLKTF